LSFALTNAGANTIFGNNTASSAAPSYFSPILSSPLFANQGTASTVLHGNVSGNPSWGAISLTTDISGLLAVANGGTGISTAATPGAVLYGSSATALGYSAAGTSGQVLVSGGTGAPSWTSAPTGITIPISKIALAAASNTIDNTNYAQTWNWSTATTQYPLTLTGNTLTTASLLSLTGASTLTSGSLLSISGGITASTTKGLLNIQNTAASTTGTVATIQANSTAGTGLTVLANGSVGIGTAAPGSTLEVKGAAVNTAPTLGTTATIDFSTNNLAYTSYVAASPAFTLSNMKAGGAYTLVLTGTTNTGTATFTAAGFTVKYMGTSTMTTAKTHIYSFIVVGTYVFVTMATEN